MSRTEPFIARSLFLRTCCAAALCCALLLLSACGKRGPAEPAAPLPASHRFTIQIGDVPTQLELALNETERARGLMQREGLAPDSGMLFLFTSPAPRSFWMRNTPLPLDIGYFNSAGRLIETHQLFPFDEKPVRSRSVEVLIAVEMEQGWFKRNKISQGDEIDLNALVEAIEARGFDPNSYALKFLP